MGVRLLASFDSVIRSTWNLLHKRVVPFWAMSVMRAAVHRKPLPLPGICRICGEVAEGSFPLWAVSLARVAVLFMPCITPKITCQIFNLPGQKC